jgi:hypothetical protein
MRKFMVVAAAMGIGVLVGGCKKGGSDSATVAVNQSIYTAAKQHYDNGKFADARASCKLISENDLRRATSDEGKKLCADVEGLCHVDIPASEATAQLEKGTAEKSQFMVKEEYCPDAKRELGYFPTYNGADRAAAKALADAVTKYCSEAALDALAAPTASTPSVTPASVAVTTPKRKK